MRYFVKDPNSSIVDVYEYFNEDSEHFSYLSSNVSEPSDSQSDSSDSSLDNSSFDSSVAKSKRRENSKLLPLHFLSRFH